MTFSSRAEVLSEERKVVILMPLQTLSAFSTPGVILHHCPLRDQY